MVKKAQHEPNVIDLTPAIRAAKINSIIEKSAKTTPGAVMRSSQTNSNYLLRRPTGIMSLDLAMAGGWPASAPSVLVGPEGVGKDYLLWRTMAETQKLYGDNFCAAVYFTEFRPDKKYMKDICGFQVAFSEEEIEEMDMTRRAARLPSLTAEQLDYYRHQVGEFVAIFGCSADHGFDKVFELTQANICQVVAVNSIGFLQTEAKEQTESFEEFPQQRNEAMLLTKVMPKFAMYMNQVDERGQNNETTLLLINQVRSKDTASRPMKGRPLQDRDKYQSASNSYALKHGKAIEVELHNGSKIYDESTKPALYVGRKKQWRISKGKLGTHEGITGEFDYFMGYGADVLGDLVNVSTKLGVIETSGSWYSYDHAGFKFKTQGPARVLELLRKQPELAMHLRERCLQTSEIVCRHR